MSSDFDEDDIYIRQPPRSDSVTLVLSLMLILLLFFVRLYLMTSPDQPKSQAVIDEVKNTFKGVGPRTIDIERTEAAADIVVPAREYQADIMRMFKTEFPVVDIDIFNQGNLMRITLEAEELHEKASGVIRGDRGRFLDVLAFAINGYPEFERPEIEYVIGTGFYLPDVGTKYLSSIEIARAGAFARALTDRAVNPASVSVGTHNGDKNVIQVLFYTRTIQDAAITFEQWYEAEQQRKEIDALEREALDRESPETIRQ